MFTELFAVARHTALQISVSPEGARLNVLIVPKPGDDADEGSALTRPIQAIGTPEELDAELPAKLAEYCAAINDLRLKIDLPIEAITAEAGKEDRQKKKASKGPHAPAPRKPARTAAPRPVKPVKKAATVKPASPAAMANAARRDRRTKELAAGPSPALQARMAERAPDKASATKKSKRASREACLADLRAWLAANAGKPITRAGFLASNATARSYERKFKSWEEFIAEGRKAPDEWEDKFPVPGEASAASPADETLTATPGEALPPVPDSAYPLGAVPLESTQAAAPVKETLSRTALNPAAKWPFPTIEPVAAPEAQADTNATAPLFPE